VLAQANHREGGRWLRRLELIWVDGKYAGKLEEFVTKTYGITLQVVKRAKDAVGFVVLPRRWVIERTFGWFGRYRRLSRDYEFLLLTSEVLIYAAMVRLMLARLTRD
jgi:putative transposase